MIRSLNSMASSVWICIVIRRWRKIRICSLFYFLSVFLTWVCWFNTQDIVSLLEDQLRPLVQSELSVLGDVLYRPEFMFPRQSEAWHKSKSGGFVSRYNWTGFNLFKMALNYKRSVVWCNSRINVCFGETAHLPLYAGVGRSIAWRR